MTIEIERCRLSYRCTQREALDPLPGALCVRFCGECQSAVHLAKGKAEFDELARQGRCVAVGRADMTSMVGVPQSDRRMLTETDNQEDVDEST